MSRYDGPTEPDPDRYEPKPIEDIDVPDFDAPDPSPADIIAAVTAWGDGEPATPSRYAGMISHPERVRSLAIEVNVPDFDEPDHPSFTRPSASMGRTIPNLSGTGPTGSRLAETIDPAEHAMHALVDALATLDQQIATAPTLERANLLRKMLKRAWADVTRVTDNAGDQVDRFVERLR